MFYFLTPKKNNLKPISSVYNTLGETTDPVQFQLSRKWCHTASREINFMKPTHFVRKTYSDKVPNRIFLYISSLSEVMREKPRSGDITT